MIEIILGFVISRSAVLFPRDTRDKTTNTHNKAVGVIGFFNLIFFGSDNKINLF
jgi:hypothetical protein